MQSCCSPMAANHILGLDDGKKRFLDAMAAITKAFSLCSTLDAAAPLRKEIAFFSAIKAAIIKHTTVDKKRTEEEKNSVLNLGGKLCRCFLEKSNMC